MNFIKNFNQIHYKHYLSKINQYIGTKKNVNEWIKSLDNGEINTWLYLTMILENDSNEYYEEISILLTILIHFFIIELNVDFNNIKLKNKDILNIYSNFKNSLYREYSNRNKIVKYKREEYYLLK